MLESPCLKTRRTVHDYLSKQESHMSIINYNQSISPPDADQLPREDYALRRIVEVINGSSTEVPITIFLSSRTIMGTLISIDSYYDALSEKISLTVGRSSELCRVLNELKDATGGLPYNIHLKDVKIFTSEAEVPTKQMRLWRGKISVIDGYAFGE
jgi:hypothetical protein